MLAAFARFGRSLFTKFLFVFSQARGPVFNRDNLFNAQAQCS